MTLKRYPKVFISVIYNKKMIITKNHLCDIIFVSNPNFTTNHVKVV